jgi:hypothetical protein
VHAAALRARLCFAGEGAAARSRRHARAFLHPYGLGSDEGTLLGTKHDPREIYAQMTMLDNYVSELEPSGMPALSVYGAHGQGTASMSTDMLAIETAKARVHRAQRDLALHTLATLTPDECSSIAKKEDAGPPTPTN